jgi:taurine dioxygenase
MGAPAPITITPLSPCVGAEIGNIDLTQPLAQEQVSALKDALGKYCVLFFREQPIDLAAHRRFAQYFGELHIHVGGEGTASKPDPNYPEARVQHFDRNSKRVSGEVWHTDQSCAAIPPMASILHQTIIPPDGGGDTLFASMYAAYGALRADESLPRRADGHA